jgi:hypothetical protein
MKDYARTDVFDCIERFYNRKNKGVSTDRSELLTERPLLTGGCHCLGDFK